MHWSKPISEREREISTTLEQAASHFVLLFFVHSFNLWVTFSPPLSFYFCFSNIFLLFYGYFVAVLLNKYMGKMQKKKKKLILVGSPFCYAHVRRELSI